MNANQSCVYCRYMEQTFPFGTREVKLLVSESACSERSSTHLAVLDSAGLLWIAWRLRSAAHVNSYVLLTADSLRRDVTDKKVSCFLQLTLTSQARHPPMPSPARDPKLAMHDAPEFHCKIMCTCKAS